MKKVLLTALLVIAAGTVGCGAKAVEGEIADGPANAIPGTWQTASIVYVNEDDMQPEYYVQFTGEDVNYGHMKEEAFVLDHSDKISEFEKTAEGTYKVKAESAGGIQYTYQTAEGDADILEYYETWNEEDFSEMYRGGASLSRVK